MATIVVGYDGSEPAKRALDRAAALADGGTVTVVSAVHPLVGKGAPGYDPVEKDQHTQHLAEAQETLSALGVACEVVEGYGDPARVIVEQAKETGADLIVVGTSHKNFLERLLEGSVADSVTHHATTEVLVVP
ncbi:MAG TPA: universal stress protein [Gaiellaceae bacterium]|nr:universal stress protein [Gaiellaceae bacterium]